MKNITVVRKIIFISVFLVSGWSCSNDNEINDEQPKQEQKSLFNCEDGMAGPYPCNGYDLIGLVKVEEMVGTSLAELNDVWGWTDPETNNEYAVVGTSHGVGFVDISSPAEPQVIGFLASATLNNPIRDVKVFKNYALTVSEAEGHGMQIFDLTKLREVSDTPREFVADARYTEFGEAHNIAVNEESGFAYVVGSDTYDGGPHFVDLSNPEQPVAAGGFSGSGRTHDAQVVTYNGPDTDYTGREIFIGSNEDRILIADVTDKSAPKLISEIDYKDVGFTHQGWLTDNMKYFMLGDEFDERDLGYNTRTLVFDFTDLDQPQFHMQYIGATRSIDHNGYVKGNSFYLASYTAGFRVIDIADLNNKSMNEIGYFDTYPQTNEKEYHGAWSVYPYFKSGNIIVSDIDNGLFILRKTGN